MLLRVVIYGCRSNKNKEVEIVIPIQPIIGLYIIDGQIVINNDNNDNHDNNNNNKNSNNPNNNKIKELWK